MVDEETYDLNVKLERDFVNVFIINQDHKVFLLPYLELHIQDMVILLYIFVGYKDYSVHNLHI